MRWTLLVKLPLLLLGAYLVDVAVGNLTWIGLLSIGLPVDVSSAIGAGVFVVAMVGVEGLLSGWARAWGRWGLWSLVWLMHAAGSLRLRWPEEAQLGPIILFGPVLLAAVILAWRQLSRPKSPRLAPPLNFGAD